MKTTPTGLYYLLREAAGLALIGRTVAVVNRQLWAHRSTVTDDETNYDDGDEDDDDDDKDEEMKNPRKRKR